jgi:heat-inducible transcriptional repressor
MEELSERQKFILTLLIHEYIRTASPVGSEHLVNRYHLDMSSATVRNELAALTDSGYLRSPHTSAGRVPTEEGYRYFVGRLLQETELPDETRRTITHQFYQIRGDVEQWSRLAASVLANHSRAASLVTAPHPDETRVKHIELISTRGRQVLMVMVMIGGEIHQRLITLAEPVPQEQLSATADRITQKLQGKNYPSILALQNQVDGLELEVVDWALDDIKRANELVAGEIYLEGLTNVLAEPEFATSEEARRTLRLLEERSVLQELLSGSILSGAIGAVQVLIGGEGSWTNLRQCSIVLARYGSPGLATGTLGVVGPMRMPYGRTISTVRFVAGLMSDMVSETMLE